MSYVGPAAASGNAWADQVPFLGATLRALLRPAFHPQRDGAQMLLCWSTAPSAMLDGSSLPAALLSGEQFAADR
jgi:hypothetical protein